MRKASCIPYNSMNRLFYLTFESSANKHVTDQFFNVLRQNMLLYLTVTRIAEIRLISEVITNKIPDKAISPSVECNLQGRMVNFPIPE